MHLYDLYRVAHDWHPVTLQTFTEAVELLPEKYKLTAGGERFFATQVILWRMVIQHLCSLWVQSVIDLLKQFKVWYADRTFSTAPVPYAQVYILFGNKSEGKILPCAFGVLPNKQMVTYISFWTQIKRMIDSKFFSRKCKNFLKTMSFIAAKINCSKELVEFSALIPLIAQYLKNS